MESSRRGALARTITALLGALLLCFLIVHLGRKYGPTAWHSLRLVNTIVNLMPTFLAVLFAFVVDKDLAGRRRWRWVFRTFVFVCGVSLSGLLWHQQSLSDIQSANQISDAVNQAVLKANQHSDKKFEMLHSQVQGLGKQLDDNSQQFGQTLGTINMNLGRVSQPTPVERAKLQLSLWKEDLGPDELPLTQMSVAPDKDGNYKIGFLTKNKSEVLAKGVEVWIQICTECSFANEPLGLDKPTGTEEHIRHATLGDLNGGVAQVRDGIEVRFNAANKLLGFLVQLSGTCENCGGIIEKPQPFKIAIVPGALPR